MFLRSYRATGDSRSLHALLNARGRATARLYELDELMMLMSNSSSIRPALEEVRVSLYREKNISEKYFRKKVVGKMTAKFLEKISQKMTRKNDRKMTPKMTRKNDRKVTKKMGTFS